MDDEIRLLLSCIILIFGALIMLFGLDLHNKYQYGQSYETAFHASIPAGLVLIAGGAVIILGLLGILGSLLGPSDKK